MIPQTPDTRIPQTVDPDSPDISRERLELVDKARQTWIRKLVDLSRRNNLLYFRDLKVGSLDLTSAEPEALTDLLQSGRAANDGVSLGDLFPAALRSPASAALAEIWKRARINFEEHGLKTLFLALGLASWTAEDDGRDAASPVLLLPLEINQQGARGSSWTMRRIGDLRVNDVLLHALEVEHGVQVLADSLIPEVLGDDEGEIFDLEPVFSKLKSFARRVPGFAIESRWVIGNFAFQKLAIVKDLKELLLPLARHELVAGIAGDRQAAEQARGDRSQVDTREFDLHSPDEEFLILDADSSQQQAIAATLKRRNGVISGPPGTGKSQTIANLIAELVARGRTVLFVAEKRAALDVVLSRLRAANLAHLCLDCHGAEISRKLVAKQLQESLAEIRDAALPDTAALHSQFIERRNRLNEHVRVMHAPRQLSGLSLFGMYGRFLRIPEDARSSARFSGAVLARMDHAAVDAGCELLKEAAALAPLVTGQSPSPWNGAKFNSGEVVRSTIDRTRRLAGDLWKSCETALEDLLGDCPVARPKTIMELRRMLRALSDIDHTLRGSRDGLFRAELDSLALALAPASSFARTLGARLFDSGFRRALKEVRAFQMTGKLSPKAALELVERTRAQLGEWQAMAIDGSVLRTSKYLERAMETFRAVSRELDPLIAVFPGRNVDDLRLVEIEAWLRDLAADTVTPPSLYRIHEIEQQLDRHGALPVLADIRNRKPAPVCWPDSLRSAWLASCIEEIQVGEPTVPAFRGRRQDEIASEFKELDSRRLELAVQRVKRMHAVAAIEARNRFKEQSALVSREAQKKARHLPLRKLFAQAPDVLLALRPCWMASPLSVSQLIPGDRAYFDVVIFDEASQVLPEDAVTSLLRGRQAVIAGDRRQLPPTTFFATGELEEDGDEDEATGGFESILDVMSSLLDPPWSLDWHYRSRDEALIAFSNHRIYGGRLVTFPGPGLTCAVSHELVPQEAGVGAQEQSTSKEVERVVELIIEHAESRPSESLGVITMGIAHAQRIEMALDRARQARPELDDFFAAGRAEHFFVKNLERVQGDEREAIILSIGYGKNEAGHLVYRFGPLLHQGGERRLNVAITRARRRMTVVSSFSHADVDPSYPKEGVRLLRSYLEYAASGGRSLGLGQVMEVPLNDFEQTVHDELERRGLRLAGQVGSSRYRIDLVAMHPARAGRFVLAIECDGATYHSAPTARDRDRLRQQQLEALGWRFCRIWSTDWFQRRDEEVARVLKAFEEAVRWADEADARGESIPSARNESEFSALPEEPIARERGRRPRITPGLTINEYTYRDLERMVEWVQSDQKLRTDDEIVTELIRELGFKRRGSAIVDAITRAITRVKGFR